MEYIEPSPEPILVVEDEGFVRTAVVRKLERAGHQAVGCSNGLEALDLLRERQFGVILSDVYMPRLSGLELLQIVRQAYPDLVIVMFTGYAEMGNAITAMKLGASDYLVKPLDLPHLVPALERALRERYRNAIRRKIEAERTSSSCASDGEANKRLLLGTVMALANTLEAKDPYTVGHSQRVSKLASSLGERLNLSEQQIANLRLAGLLHDIGKIGIREEIINKKGPLTRDEYIHIESHPLISERILLPVVELEASLDAVRHHHERWDGHGYPDSLGEMDIPLGARMLALVDAYDAMTSERPYRHALACKVALQEVSRNAGRQFDPELADLLIEAVSAQPVLSAEWVLAERRVPAIA